MRSIFIFYPHFLLLCYQYHLFIARKKWLQVEGLNIISEINQNQGTLYIYIQMHSNNEKKKYAQQMRVQFTSKSQKKERRKKSSDQQDYNQQYRKRSYKRRYNNQSHRYQQQISISSSSSERQGRKSGGREKQKGEEKGKVRDNNKIVSQQQQEESQDGVIRFEKESEKSVTEKEMIPWMSNGTRTIKDSLLRFHNEIIEFYNYIKPSKKGHAAKLKRFHFIRDRIMEIFPKADVIAFGSFATQLYLPDGDIDIAVLSNSEYQVSEIYTRINKYLQSHKKQHKLTNIEYIRKSKVPLIKFQYQYTHFDISVDKTDGIAQIRYIQKINELFPEFKYLTLLLKCTLRIRGLSDTYTGGIGSFLLSCMIWVYLKISHEKKSYLNLAEHVIQFIKFYALNDQYWRNKVLYVKEAKIVDRYSDGTYFSCISPQDQTHDIGKSAFKIRQVFNVLKNRCRYILDKNFSPEQSILRVLVNPSEIPFKYLKQ